MPTFLEFSFAQDFIGQELVDLTTHHPVADMPQKDREIFYWVQNKFLCKSVYAQFVDQEMPCLSGPHSARFTVRAWMADSEAKQDNAIKVPFLLELQGLTHNADASPWSHSGFARDMPYQLSASHVTEAKKLNFKLMARSPVAAARKVHELLSNQLGSGFAEDIQLSKPVLASMPFSYYQNRYLPLPENGKGGTLNEFLPVLESCTASIEITDWVGNEITIANDSFSLTDAERNTWATLSKREKYFKTIFALDFEAPITDKNIMQFLAFSNGNLNAARHT